MILLSSPAQKLTHHCCRCNKVLLYSGEWLREVIVKILGVKPSHGFCPECRDILLSEIVRRKAA